MHSKHVDDVHITKSSFRFSVPWAFFCYFISYLERFFSLCYCWCTSSLSFIFFIIPPQHRFNPLLLICTVTATSVPYRLLVNIRPDSPNEASRTEWQVYVELFIAGSIENFGLGSRNIVRFNPSNTHACSFYLKHSS